MKKYRVRGGVVAALGAIALVGSCGQASDGPEREENPLAAALAEAKGAQADQSQIDILSQDEVEFADYEAAMDRALACMKDGRISVGAREIKEQNGQDVVSYTFSKGAHSEDDALEIHDDCYEKHAQFVDSYWQTGSPDAVAFAERRAEALKDPLEKCLEGYDVDHPDDASFQELIRAAAQHLGIDESQDCLGEVGYSEWDG